MILTTSQVFRFWREWSASCKVMNWTREAGLTAAQIDIKRKELLAQCGFKSLTEVDRTNGFTKVLNELLVLQGTSLKAGQESQDPSLNQGRVIRHNILTEIIPCLEMYREDVKAYVTKLIQDKSRWWKLDRPAREMTLMDLDSTPIMATDKKTGEAREFPSQLEQIRFTLAARLNELRNQAGDTIHDMKIKAELECNCAKCVSARNQAAPIIPAISEKQTEPHPF